MSMIETDAEVSGFEDLLASVQRSVRDLRHDIEDLREQVQSGGDIDAAETTRTLNRARAALEHCQKVETSLAECKRKQAGIAKGDHALDLNAARADIGCKLDRLRRCRDAKPVSE